jgi:lipoprotein-anchoring transpeptidase ErfK/SrfK
MHSPSTLQRVLTVMLATVLLALSASMSWAAVNDYVARTNVPRGVTVAGTDLSGMDETQARTAIESAVSAPLLRPVTVVADERDFVFDPKGSVSIDVDGMLDEAFAPRRNASYLARLQHDVAGASLSADVEPRFTVDQTKLDEWIAGVAEQIDRPAIDANRSVVDNKIKIRKSKSGRRTELIEAAVALSEAFSTERALAEENRVVTVPVQVLKPKISTTKLGKAIVVSLSQRRVRLYDGEKLEVTYRCAIGTPSHPTPQGEFEVVQKRYMPTWVNPAPNGWGASMPKRIAPGPSNPLGTRALNLSASGIRFHGTTNIGSIGTAASHGCMRMRRGDIEDFYPRVEVGTKVYILP